MAMWLELGNTTARVLKCSSAEREWLTEFLTFTDEKQRFAGGDMDRGMLDILDDTFPSGLFPIVQKEAAKQGYDLQVKDARCKPQLDEAAVNQALYSEADETLAWLRDYQRTAVQRIAEKTRGIVWCPTGSGKTEIAIGAVKALPVNWLFIVHRATLVQQTADRFRLRTGEEAGVIGKGTWSQNAATARLTCATFQSLNAAMIGNAQARAKLKALLESRQGVIVDECHVLPADSFWRLAMAVKAYYRVGLSGTPLARGDRRSLLAIAALGPVIYRIKSQLLIDRGVLARPTIRMLEVRQRCELTHWPDVYRKAIVESTTRNRAVLEACERCSKPAFLFVREIAHGKLLENMLNRKGIRARFVWGKHSPTWRQQAVKELVRDRIDVLVCSVVFQEGIDVPELRAVVVASGDASVIATLQRGGRGMRPDAKSGKTEFEIWDIADRGCGCSRTSGGPTWHKGCEWLERHTNKRLHAFASEGFQTTVEQVVLPVG